MGVLKGSSVHFYSQVLANFFFLLRLGNLYFQELGLLAGTPVGTSLIDAHAGGVGVMESVPEEDSEVKGLLMENYFTFFFNCLINGNFLTFWRMLHIQQMIMKLYAIAWCWSVALLLVIWPYHRTSCLFLESGDHFGQVHSQNT